MLEAQGEFGSQMAPLTEQALLATLPASRSMSGRRAQSRASKGPGESGSLRTIASTPAVSFLDLSGFTRLTEEGGDEVAASLAASLKSLVRQSSREHGGESVKWLGDGVMLFFPDPGNGVLASLDMVERAGEEGLPPARAGIHAGQVVFQEGDYFGRTVNVAARIADYARPGRCWSVRRWSRQHWRSPLSSTRSGPSP